MSATSIQLRNFQTNFTTCSKLIAIHITITYNFFHFLHFFTNLITKFIFSFLNLICSVHKIDVPNFINLSLEMFASIVSIDQRHSKYSCMYLRVFSCFIFSLKFSTYALNVQYYIFSGCRFFFSLLCLYLCLVRSL